MTNDNLQLKEDKRIHQAIARTLIFIVMPITWGQVFLWMAILG